MSAVIVYNDFGAQEKKICHCFHFFLFYLPEVMGPDVMILVFLMLSFKPAFSLSSFTLIKRFFSSSSLYPIRVVSYAYLRLLIFLSAVLIPACDSSSPAFCMMYSAYKLNKQGDQYIALWYSFPNFEPWDIVTCQVLLLLGPHTRFSGDR